MSSIQLANPNPANLYCSGLIAQATSFCDYAKSSSRVNTMTISKYVNVGKLSAYLRFGVYFNASKTLGIPSNPDKPTFTLVVANIDLEESEQGKGYWSNYIQPALWAVAEECGASAMAYENVLNQALATRLLKCGWVSNNDTPTSFFKAITTTTTTTN